MVLTVAGVMNGQNSARAFSTNGLSLRAEFLLVALQQARPASSYTNTYKRKH